MKLEELHDFLKVHNYNFCIASGSSVTHIKRLVKNYGFDLKADLMLSSKDVYASKLAPGPIFGLCNRNECYTKEF